MPTCHVCRQDNPTGARFCNACGSPLDGEARPLREERKVVTVLFADLVGFTARANGSRGRAAAPAAVPRPAALSPRAARRHGREVRGRRGDGDLRRARRARGRPRARRQGRAGDPGGACRRRRPGGPHRHHDRRSADHARRKDRAGRAHRLRRQRQHRRPPGVGRTGRQHLRRRGDSPGDRAVDRVRRRASGRGERQERPDPRVGCGPTPHAGRRPASERHTARGSRAGAHVAPRDGRSGPARARAAAPHPHRGPRDRQDAARVGARPRARPPWRLGLARGSFPAVRRGSHVLAVLRDRARLHGCARLGRRRGATRKIHGAVAAVVPEPSEVAWLERHLRPLVGIDTDDLGSGDRRGEAFTAWRRLLEALAEEQPLVLVFDDLHWADDALLDFVDHVVDWASGVPILVLATARPDLLDRRPDWGGGRANVTALRLSPLSLEETTRLFGALFAEPAAPQRAHADLLERAGGNPFYAEEFARMVLDGHSDRGLPGSVQGLIAARLDGLALDEKELLQNAAVVGRVFWIGPLGDDRPRLEAALHALARREFVRRERRSSIAGETEYSFRHTLIRDVAYEQIPKARRAEKHLVAAGWIESRPRREDYAEMLASHYLRAVEYADAGGVVSEELVERAVRALRDAGDRALSLHAYAQAVGFYERAIALQPAGAPGPRRELLLSLGDALARAGDQERARETFLTAAELARRSGSAGHLARAALGYGGRFVWSRAWGDPHLVPLLEEALALLGDTDDDLRIRLLTRLAAGPLRDTLPPAPREAMSDEALRMARRLGDRAALAYALEGRHCANMGPQTVDRRRAIADELIAVAEQVEDTERAYAGHEYRFHALLEAGDAATARQAFEAMTRIAGELRQPAQLWFAGVNRAKLALFEGRFDDADALIRAAFELGQQDWTANPRMAFDLQTYQLNRERGLLSEMVDVVERAVAEHPTYPVLSYVLLDVDTELGREDQARAAFDRLAAEGFPLYLEMQWLFGMSLLPEVCRYLDDPEGADAVYARLRPFGHLNATLPPELCRGPVSRGLGILAATMARWSEAVEHFEVALRMNAELGARPWLAHTQYELRPGPPAPSGARRPPAGGGAPDVGGG